MKRSISWRVVVPQILLGLIAFTFFLLVRITHAGYEPVPLVTDWSHRHLVFSPPQDLMHLFRLSGNVRYMQQWERRNARKVEPIGNRWIHHEPHALHGDWSMNMGSGATVGVANYPAKFSFNTGTANCGNATQPDFVVYNTSVAGSSSQATIVAFDNLYSGCTGTVPSTYWAYNTGTTGAVVTSPVLSADGTQVAFIQSTGGAANLVLLKWAASAGTLTAPVTLTSVGTSSYRACTAPCMVTIAFGNGAINTESSPFYDYAPGSDSLYVGDSTGYLHKFTGVFNGTPGEAGSPWPVQAATAPLTSPIYDQGSGYVFVNASFQYSDDSGGRLHGICATATCGTVGSTVSSAILGPVTSGSSCTSGTSGDAANLYMDAPVVDSTNETIYVVLGNDGDDNSALFQFKSSSISNSCGTKVTLGTGSTTGVPIYAGSFDNLYYTGSAGHMYICGNIGGDPTLYQISVAANGTMTAGAATAGPVLTTATTTCGSVVEFYNPNASGGATDWIFTSVQANAQSASPISCPNTTYTGCIMSFNVTSGAAISGTTATVGHMTVSGGASGVGVDNTVGSGTLAGASQVYFTPLKNQTCTTSGGTGGCAIQASQSALQ